MADIKPFWESLRGRLSTLRTAVNWKVVLAIGIAISLVLCLSHAYRFMKIMGV